MLLPLLLMTFYIFDGWSCGITRPIICFKKGGDVSGGLNIGMVENITKLYGCL